MSITRDTVGANLHDDFADGDATSNPAWTSESGTMSVNSGAFNPSATAANGWARTAVTINNSDLISWKAKVVATTYSQDQHRMEIGDTGRTNFYSWLIRSGTNNGEVSKRVSSTNTTLANFTESITDANFHSYAVKWNGSSLKFYIDDAEITGAAVTDSAFTTHANIRFMSLSGNSGGGSDRVSFDDVCVMDSWNITVAGLPTGWKARVRNSGGTEVKKATESSGTATIDMTGYSSFPYTDVQILDSADLVIETLSPSATVSGHSVTGVFGGDAYTFTGGRLTKTFTADAVIADRNTTTATADGVVIGVNTKTVTVDGVVLETITTTATADALVVVKSVETQTFTADGVVFATSTVTVTADAVVAEQIAWPIYPLTALPATFTADVVIPARNSTVFTADAVLPMEWPLAMLTAVPATVTADAVVTGNVVFYDVTVTGRVTKTHTADAIVVSGFASGGTRIVTADAVIRAGTTRQVTADAVVVSSVIGVQTRVRPFNADAVVATTVTTRLTSGLFFYAVVGGNISFRTVE